MSMVSYIQTPNLLQTRLRGQLLDQHASVVYASLGALS